MKIPLAEHFHSIQGEGQWVGTPMHFVRLPGCSVGKPLHEMISFHEKVPSPPPTLPSGKHAWLCHRWDGKPFWCDTDFNKYEEVELGQLLEETWEDHICITGGEPLIHPQIIEAFIENLPFARTLHIETSGTIFYDYPRYSVWVTVSPKQGYLEKCIEFADEIKLLISEEDKNPFFDSVFEDHPNVYISPINPVNGLVQHESLQIAMGILKQHPSWKLSVQLHKYLGVR